MKLYYFMVAPNPTKVRVYLAEKGIELETARVNLAEREQRAPEFLALNPLGKLPVLELDDGSCLTESLPIIEYLEELHPEPVMIGETPEERARVRSIERLADTGVLMAGARAVHATRSPLGLPPVPEIAQAGLQTVETTLGLLNARLASNRFLAGDRVSIADCTLWAALGFLGFGAFEVEAGHANVVRWKAEFGSRASTRLPA